MAFGSFSLAFRGIYLANAFEALFASDSSASARNAFFFIVTRGSLNLLSSCWSRRRMRRIIRSISSLFFVFLLVLVFFLSLFDEDLTVEPSDVLLSVLFDDLDVSDRLLWCLRLFLSLLLVLVRLDDLLDFVFFLLSLFLVFLRDPDDREDPLERHISLGGGENNGVSPTHSLRLDNDCVLELDSILAIGWKTLSIVISGGGMLHLYLLGTTCSFRYHCTYLYLSGPMRGGGVFQINEQPL